MKAQRGIPSHKHMCSVPHLYSTRGGEGLGKQVLAGSKAETGASPHLRGHSLEGVAQNSDGVPSFLTHPGALQLCERRSTPTDKGFQENLSQREKDLGYSTHLGAPPLPCLFRHVTA